MRSGDADAVPTCAKCGNWQPGVSEVCAECGTPLPPSRRTPLPSVAPDQVAAARGRRLKRVAEEGRRDFRENVLPMLAIALTVVAGGPLLAAVALMAADEPFATRVVAFVAGVLASAVLGFAGVLGAGFVADAPRGSLVESLAAPAFALVVFGAGILVALGVAAVL